MMEIKYLSLLNTTVAARKNATHEFALKNVSKTTKLSENFSGYCKGAQLPVKLFYEAC